MKIDLTIPQINALIAAGNYTLAGEAGDVAARHFGPLERAVDHLKNVRAHEVVVYKTTGTYNIRGRSMHYVGFGWLDEGPATPTDTLVTDKDGKALK